MHNAGPCSQSLAFGHRYLRTANPEDAIPLERFAGVPSTVNLQHYFPFGCPVYVFDVTRRDKWADRSKVGVYLGHSPSHSRSVALVLSLETGLVSPQFHVVFDPPFQTMREAFIDFRPRSQWQAKCHFPLPELPSESDAPIADKGSRRAPRPTERYSEYRKALKPKTGRGALAAIMVAMLSEAATALLAPSAKRRRYHPCGWN